MQRNMAQPRAAWKPLIERERDEEETHTDTSHMYEEIRL